MRQFPGNFQNAWYFVLGSGLHRMYSVLLSVSSSFECQGRLYLPRIDESQNKIFIYYLFSMFEHCMRAVLFIVI